MDFTISGQVGRSLFITDTDSSTRGEIKDSNGATRARVTGDSKLEDGSEISLQFEYALDDTAKIRHANAQFINPVAGTITVGQGSEAGDGSAGLGPGVSGIGAGQVTNLSDYFGSLDGGGRINMVRYDTPAIGPVSASVSVGNGDSVSGLVHLSSEFSGTSFDAKMGTLQEKGNKSTLSASFGVTLPSGLSVGGAWGKGNDHVGRESVPRRPQIQCTYDLDGDTATTNDRRRVWFGDYPLARDTDVTCETGTAMKPSDPEAPSSRSLVPTVDADDVKETIWVTRERAGSPETRVDPSYFRLGIGYTFGDTTVAASWYNSENFVVTDSDATAIGVGVSHDIPKAGTTIHASVQQYDAKGLKDRFGVRSADQETVFQFGTLVKF